MNKFTKYLAEKEGNALNARAWAMQSAIAQEIAPKIEKAQSEFDREPVRNSKARGKVQQTSGKGSTSFHAVFTGDNGNGMEDNEPLWTAGNALANRDAQAIN